MKVLEIKSPDKEHERVTANFLMPDGSVETKQITFVEAVRNGIINAVEAAPRSNNEVYRIWLKVAGKLDKLDIDKLSAKLELEDQEYTIAQDLFVKGSEKAFPTIKDGYWANCISNIFIDAKDKEGKK